MLCVESGCGEWVITIIADLRFPTTPVISPSVLTPQPHI